MLTKLIESKNITLKNILISSILLGILFSVGLPKGAEESISFLLFGGLITLSFILLESIDVLRKVSYGKFIFLIFIFAFSEAITKIEIMASLLFLTSSYLIINDTFNKKRKKPPIP